MIKQDDFEKKNYKRVIKEHSMVKLLKHVNILNIILIIFILALGLYDYRLFKKEETLNVVDKKALASQLKKSKVKKDHNPEKNKALSDYHIVSEKNLFHPERRLIRSSKNKNTKPVEPHDIIVYGTLITENIRIAYVENRKNPYKTPGRGIRHRTIHEGEMIGGYTIKSIFQDKIELTKDDQTLTFDVIDPRKKRKSVTTKKRKSKKVRSYRKAANLRKRLKKE